MTAASTAMRAPEVWETDLRSTLRQLLQMAPIAGLESVRLMRGTKRYADAHDKVFFVLATHDIARDEAIVQLMMQFDSVDYDLVPVASAGMVPSAAVVVV